MTLPPNLQMVPRDVTEAVRFWPSVIPVGTVEPPASAKVWLDTSTEPAVMKAWDGAAWAAIGGGGGGGVPTSRTLTAGTGLTGGGDLSANRSFAVDLEYLQDQVASLIVAGTNVTKTYDDTAGTLTLAAAAGGGSSYLAAPMPSVGQYVLPWLSDSTGNPTITGLQAGNNPVAAHLITAPITVNAMVCRVMTTQASVNAKMMLFGANANGQIASRLAVTAGFTCASGAINELAITATALTPGIYWSALVTDAGTTVAFLGGKSKVGQNVTDTNGFLGSAVVFRANVGSYASPAATATIGSMNDGDTIPTIALKRSA